MGWIEVGNGGSVLEGGSGGMEARWAWKYREMSCSYIFELGDCRQGSEELPMCLISMDISQNQSLTQSSEFQALMRTLHMGAICLGKLRRTVLFKKILKPSKGNKRDSVMNLKTYSDYTNALQYLLLRSIS